MAKLGLSLIMFFSVMSATAHASINIQPGIHNYSCKGNRISGAVQIRNIGTKKGHHYPSYHTFTELWVNGTPYSWSIVDGSVRPWRKPVAGAPKGTWVPDNTKLIYKLGGREQSFDGWYTTFHVQVNNQNWNKLKGYLGYQDAEKAEVGTNEAAKYSFNCQRVN